MRSEAVCALGRGGEMTLRATLGAPTGCAHRVRPPGSHQVGATTWLMAPTVLKMIIRAFLKVLSRGGSCESTTARLQQHQLAPRRLPYPPHALEATSTATAPTGSGGRRRSDPRRYREPQQNALQHRRPAAVHLSGDNTRS